MILLLLLLLWNVMAPPLARRRGESGAASGVRRQRRMTANAADVAARWLWALCVVVAGDGDACIAVNVRYGERRGQEGGDEGVTSRQIVQMRLNWRAHGCGQSCHSHGQPLLYTLYAAPPPSAGSVVASSTRLAQHTQHPPRCWAQQWAWGCSPCWQPWSWVSSAPGSRSCCSLLHRHCARANSHQCAPLVSRPPPSCASLHTRVSARRTSVHPAALPARCGV